MSIRVTGLVSGLDTDSIVQELVSAYSTKKNKYVKAQTKLEWKMDAWKDLNKKVNSFYKKLGNLKMSSSYTQKTTAVSDPTKATVTATNSAINGTQTLSINQVAKTGYITGADLGSGVTASTKLSELGVTGDANIAVTTKNGTKNITLTDSMSVNDVVNKLKDAGISANYDTTNHRMYVSAKDTGLENDFALTATDANGVEALKGLGIYVAKDANTAAYNEWESYAVYEADGTTVDTEATKAKFAEILTNIQNYQADADNPDSIKALQQDSENKRTENTNLLNKVNYANAYSGLKDALSAEYTVTDEDGNETTKSLNATQQQEMWDLMMKAELTDEEKEDLETLKTNLGVDDETWKTMQSNASVVKKFDTYLLNDTLTNEERNELQGVKDDVIAAYAAGGTDQVKADLVGDSETGTGWMGAIAQNNDDITANTEAIAEKNAYINQYTLLTNAAPAGDGISINDRVDALMNKMNFAIDQLNNAGSATYSDAVLVTAQDAKITLNGVDYTSASNNITVNGLTVTALQVTQPGEDLTITTSANVQGMYDTIKGLIKDYNELIKEMDTLYNAESSKGYEPLTDEEKEAMTDKEIEKWEEKIKSSILRRDSNLSSVMNIFTSSMTKGFTLSDGKTYSLASFGIKTQGYFASEDNERSVFHIDGDPDDELTSGETDKLMAAIQDNPDIVTEFFQKLSGNLYDQLYQKMGHSTTSHSIFTIYNDKTMKNEYDEYTTTIKKWEEKLQDKEDYYYDQFSAMETALSKLQSQTNSLSSLFGS